MSTTEKSFHGYIETTRDSLIILEACRRGLLPRISRRLQEKERQLVQSGAVFCFDENESGIKRWTDGLVWSPSRILGNFLIYRELDKRAPQNDSVRTSCQNVSERQRERALVGSLTNSYRFKRNGLIKKSMSIVVNGVQQHLISYYSKDDVLNDRLQTPSTIPALATLEISPDLLLRQNFRIPLFLDVTPPSPTTPQRLRHQQQRTTPPLNSVSSTTPSMTSASSSPSPSSPLSPTEKRKDDIIELNLERSAIRQKRRFMPMQQQQQQQQQQPRNYRGHSTSSISTASSVSSSTTNIPSNMTPPPTQATTAPAPDGCICGRSKVAQAAAAQRQQQEQLRQNHELPVSQQSTHHHSNSANTTSYVATQQQAQLPTINQPSASQQPPQQIRDENNPGDFHVSYGVGTSFPPMGGPAGLYSSYHLDRQDQNPHQHLFYSTSLHAVNHSAIPLRSEVISNAFMLDPNYLLGSGWNEFEMQL